MEICRVPPNDAEVDDKSLQSDDGASTNLLNLPLATAGGLASATATGGDKKIDKDKQNSVASTILLSISKQLIAHPSDMKVSFIEAKKLSMFGKRGAKSMSKNEMGLGVPRPPPFNSETLISSKKRTI